MALVGPRPPPPRGRDLLSPPGDDIPVPRSLADGLYRAAIFYRDQQRALGTMPPRSREADNALAAYLDLRSKLRGKEPEG